MGLSLRTSLVPLCALFSFLAFLPSAAAQFVASPASVERTVEAGETAAASLTLTNTGPDEASFFVRITEPPPPRLPGFVQARTGSALRLAPPATREAWTVRSPIRLSTAREAFLRGAAQDDLRGVATDSIFYDNGDDVPGSFLGTGQQNTSLFVAQRFSPTGPFTLDGIRAFFTTSTFEHPDTVSVDLSVSVEVYEAADPNEPRAGLLLGAAETGFQAGFEGFAEIPLDGSLTFGAGEDFFVILEVVGPSFPAAFDFEGGDAAAGRAFASLSGDVGAWVNLDEIAGYESASFLIRALSGTGTSGGFLTVTPASGTLAPAADTTLSLDLDATPLFAGTYQRTIEIVDVATGTFASVPVTLTVTGEGVVVLNQEAVDLGDVFVGSAGGVTLFLANVGTAPLTITGSNSSDPALEAFGLPVDTLLAPGSEVPFAVRFAPTVPGPFSGTLTILTDAGDVSVAVTALAQATPQASVTPDSLAATLLPGDVASLPITIANTGEGVLSYGVTIESGNGGVEGGAVQDSLFYDDGDALPDNLLGTFDTVPFFLAQRFSTDRPFVLNAVGVFVSTFPAGHHGEEPPPDSTFDPLMLSVEVYEVVDPNEPTAGTLLASASTAIDAAVAEFIAVPLGGAVELAAGGDVFVVVGYEGVNFPAGFDASGTGDFEGRAFLSLTGGIGEWDLFPDFSGVGTPSVPLIRALSLDTSGLVVSADAPSGEVAPGAEATITLTVDATTAEPGSFTRTIAVSTNDPERPRLEVPLTIVVEGSGMMALAEGWNLVSWNVEPADPPLEAVLAAVWEDVESVRMLGDEGWVSYDAADLSEAGLSLQPGEAIWVKMRSANWLPMEGDPMPMDGLDLDAGLNAVAYLPDFVDLAAHAFASIADVSESVQSFYSTGVAYAPGVPAAFQTLGTVRPGMGYLAHTSVPVRLDYPLVAATMPFEGVSIGALVMAEAEADVTPSPAWVSVWGQGFTGLAPGTLVTAVDPDGVVSGAFSVQTEGALGLMAIYGDDPATDADEGARPGDTVALRTEAGELASVVWTEPGAVFDVSGQVVSNEADAGVPAAFALRSTYPNPFAERTSVAFDLAAATDVSLDVYDTTGRRVATLVRGPMPAGAHEATWEARGAASGLYVVTLRAGDFLATRTMVLLR